MGSDPRLSEGFQLTLQPGEMVYIPPGVWHALRNESGAPAGYINVVDEMFDYEKPDNYRLPADSTEAPDIL